jgi:hypothetical protein
VNSDLTDAADVSITDPSTDINRVTFRATSASRNITVICRI